MQNESELRIFKRTIRNFYRNNKRELPWRMTDDPYKILVSEVMLQQTQVSRVIPKYESFLKKFPTIHKLAEAPVRDVLIEWQGLGYNRRAMHLKKCAEVVMKDHKGKFPKDLKSLLALPGVGKATAGDILAFAWNIPVPLIETNIRSVFIYFFFKNKESVSDKEILPLVEKTLDRKNPREWYWALFDYGSYLKESSNPSRKSKHYIQQSRFKGSHREKRSLILKEVLKRPQSAALLSRSLPFDRIDITSVLNELEREGMIRKAKNMYTI